MLFPSEAISGNEVDGRIFTEVLKNLAKDSLGVEEIQVGIFCK